MSQDQDNDVECSTRLTSVADSARSFAAMMRAGAYDPASDAEMVARKFEECAYQIEHHTDAQAARRFASLMTVKMAKGHHKGRHGWQNVPVNELWRLLKEHVEKRDPVDIANFAMMIHHNSEAHPEEASEGDWSADGHLTLTAAYYDQADRVAGVLMLVSDVAVDEAEVAAWTSQQRKAAAEWAVSLHLAASDNDDVVVPPRPDFIRHADDSNRHPITGAPIDG